MVEVSGSKGRPHALAIVLPVQGHINPMMQLAIKLASRGCIVTIVNLESNHRRMVGSENSSLLDLDIRFEAIPDRVPVEVASLDIFSSVENRQIFRKAYQAMEADVMELLQDKLAKSPSSSECPVSFILGDVYLNWIGRLAKAVGLPTIFFSTTCASSILIDYWIPRLLETRDIPLETGETNENRKVVAELPGIPRPLVASDLPFYFDSPRDRLPERYAKAKALSECHGVVINSAEFLEPEAFKVLRAEVNSNIFPVGPLLDVGEKSTTNAAWTTDTKCLDWLNSKKEKSVLYVSFGSVATLPPQQVLEIAEGMKLCSSSILWVLRPNLIGSTDETSQALKVVLEELHSSGKACVVAWAPQLQVLAHSAVAGFLSHCGWNSVLEAVWHGVPLLAWPQIVEQSLVARIICGEWKVGMRMPQGLIERTVISRLVDEFMASDEFGRNCHALQKMAKSSAKELDLGLVFP